MNLGTNDLALIVIAIAAVLIFLFGVDVVGGN